MRAAIFPSQPTGSIVAPPSKSMAHRLLLAAGLAHGESTVRGIASSQDVLATIDCLRALGASVELDGETATVRGCDPTASPSAVLQCRESGSTLRFFAPVCALCGQDMTLEGAKSLLRRPLEVYETLFHQRGLLFERTTNRLVLRGPLPSGSYTLPGDVSSQFVSGLLFALPLTEADSNLFLQPPVESRAYIDMTLSALHAFGVTAHWSDELTLAIPGAQSYRPCCANVEGDWSNAAFFLALGVPVTGLDDANLQSDRVCTEYFAALDAGRATLDISGCPDLGPLLMAYAAERHGGEFIGTRRLRLKESDRGAAMAEELEKFGVAVCIGENSITVTGGACRPTSTLYGHNDHRVVMALSVLCTHTGGTVEGAEAIGKSFPDFFERLQDLGVEMELN